RPLSFQPGDDDLQTRTASITGVLNGMNRNDDPEFNYQRMLLEKELGGGYSTHISRPSTDTDASLDIGIARNGTHTKNMGVKETKSLGYLPPLDFTNSQSLLHDEKYVVLPEEEVKSRSETNPVNSRNLTGSRRTSE